MKNGANVSMCIEKSRYLGQAMARYRKRWPGRLSSSMAGSKTPESKSGSQTRQLKVKNEKDLGTGLVSHRSIS